ncbi:MAG: hypothetical protein IH845_05120 [Nanoarchaeota archaeon]|nr:hypothetical protein [Nanoarchaeota archaeon]
MGFEYTYDTKRKKEITNKYRDKPTISFRMDNSDPEAAGYLLNLGDYGERSRFINEAINTKFLMEKYPKGFTINWIQSNFSLCKHILRQLGRAMSLV